MQVRVLFLSLYHLRCIDYWVDHRKMEALDNV